MNVHSSGSSIPLAVYRKAIHRLLKAEETRAETLAMLKEEIAEIEDRTPYYWLGSEALNG